MKVADMFNDFDIICSQRIDETTIVLVAKQTNKEIEIFLGEQSKSGIVNRVKNIGNDSLGMIKANPGLAALISGFGLSALLNYTKNKKYTTRLYAQTPYEKNFYGEMVKELEKTGKYKLIKKSHINGGLLWIIKRT